MLGLYNDIQGGALLIPDLSVMFKLGQKFRLGAGVMTFIGTDISQDYFPYVIYAAAKFSFPL